jgi:DNA mismatch repair protein MutS
MICLQKLEKILRKLFSKNNQDFRVLSRLDVYVSFAWAAQKNNFTPPVMEAGIEMHLNALRHPVVEKNLDGEWYIPNDVYMNQNSHNFLIITGPNMGGKSTYCRSIALAAILAQTGSFVPAKYAKLPVFDRIFARIGASDDLTTGQSTFMVEMNEVSNIIHNATEKSLIILDEVGRGTSTYDGLSLAWALTEYLSQKVKGKTLFATHYHELTELEKKYDNIKNLNVKVEEEGSKIIFFTKYVPVKQTGAMVFKLQSWQVCQEELLNKQKKYFQNLKRTRITTDRYLLNK